ncbi:MAG: Arabinose efflux permease family protein, partial [Frankiales bacterium]|nr:Arabinose efflux permease family protein [Frankiales bacterium]
MSGTGASGTGGGLLALREVRLVVAASLLSVLGDQVARVALAVAVYDRTGSALLSAASWALTMLPWVVGGPVLTAYADLWPRRRVLVACDLARAGVLLLLAVPGVPLLAVVLLLALAELLAPPASAAGTALLFDVLEEDRATRGAALGSTVHELGQVGGFLLGGVLVASVGSPGAFLLDAATFLLSAALLSRLPARPAAAGRREQGGLYAEVRAGWQAL